jgi:hypothetical protein
MLLHIVEKRIRNERLKELINNGIDDGNEKMHMALQTQHNGKESRSPR